MRAGKEVGGCLLEGGRECTGAAQVLAVAMLLAPDLPPDAEQGTSFIRVHRRIVDSTSSNPKEDPAVELSGADAKTLRHAVHLVIGRMTGAQKELDSVLAMTERNVTTGLALRAGQLALTIAYGPAAQELNDAFTSLHQTNSEHGE